MDWHVLSPDLNPMEEVWEKLAKHDMNCSQNLYET